MYFLLFKHIFGNDDNIPITRRFIQDVTGLEVHEITFVDPYLKQDFSSESKRIVDVLCKLDTGEKILIEIQRASQANFCRRILYYSCKIFCNSLEPGDKYFASLRNVIIIAISVNPLPLSTSASLSCHKIVDVETCTCDINGVTFYFMDLSKFLVGKDNMDLLQNPADVWFFFLKHVQDLDPNEVDRFEKRYPYVIEAIEELKKFHLSKDEHEKYTVYQMGLDESRLGDTEKLVIEALKEGKAEGRWRKEKRNEKLK